MGQPPSDSFHLHGGDDGKARPELDQIFKAGSDARRHGLPLHDNPYAAGSEERAEWAAGWSATADCDEDEDPDSRP